MTRHNNVSWVLEDFFEKQRQSRVVVEDSWTISSTMIGFRFILSCWFVLPERYNAVSAQLLRVGKASQMNHLDPIWNHVLPVSASADERAWAIPMFWHIHKAGGTTVHDILASCLNLTVAAEVGVLNGHDLDQVREDSFRDDDGNRDIRV
jgi:hypothetical protein